MKVHYRIQKVQSVSGLLATIVCGFLWFEAETMAKTEKTLTCRLLH